MRCHYDDIQTGVAVEIDLCGEKLFPNGSTTTTVFTAITNQQMQSNNGSTAVWFNPAWATVGDRYKSLLHPPNHPYYWLWLVLFLLDIFYLHL